jgi:hypothetical protein
MPSTKIINKVNIFILDETEKVASSCCIMMKQLIKSLVC